MLFKDTSLILTGASLGVGRALAPMLAAEGAALVVNARSEEPLRETMDACAAASAQAETGAAHAMVAGDASEARVAEALVREALALGDFHGFIHCAGVLAPGPTLWELSPERFGQVFAASPMAAYQLARAAYPHLVRRGRGLAVFFGSGAAERAQPGIAAYCAAKAAEEHIARQLAAEAPDILAFNYRPGIVDTRMQTQARESEGGSAEALKEVFVPWKEQGQLLTAEESAAGLVRLLAAGPERYQGGTALHADSLS